MENDGLDAALERINADASIPTIEPSQIEHVWEHLTLVRQQNRTVSRIFVASGAFTRI